ncbi:MAG TPA: hypothetical protein VFX98_11305 [Longimicrobiaceae bacterium]|nr:hypothetical protein [Longimicrobiaceae bacterium]
MDLPEQQLMWAVQALAQPADVQPTLFPPFVVAADELALDFDHWREVAEGAVGASWSQGQRSALAALDRMLAEMSEPGEPELWLGDECLRHPQWSEVRQLAQAVLSAFGWPAGLPPEGRAAYVSGSG